MAVKYERVVEEDLNLGIGVVDVSMPGGGTVVGHRIGVQSFTALGFSATMGSAQSFVGNTADAIVRYDTVEYTVAGVDWFDATTFTFTAPIDGIYRFDAYAYMVALTGRFQVSIYKNSDYVAYDEAVRSAQDAPVTVSAAFKMIEGDTATVRARHTDGSNVRNITEGRFSGFLVGRTQAE